MRTATLVRDLHRESIRARSGTGVVSIVAIASLTIGSAIAFLVAGGTWMLWERAHHIEDAAPGLMELYNDYEGFLYFWFDLALFACVFLIPALFSLTAQAAILGASGREKRLATLRLIGLSSRQVTRMTVLETGFQALIGVFLGWLLSLLVAPVFTHLSFQERQVQLEELHLPWWGYLTVAATVVLLALSAAFVGMQRVRVSPLGVARRQMPPALKRWRLILFIIGVVGGVILLKGFSFSAAQGVIIGMLSMLFLIAMSINFVAPYVLQVGAQIMANFPGTAHLVACQRIATNSKAIWRRVMTMAFFGFLAGYLVGAPLGDDGLTLAMREEEHILTVFTDVSTGALLTLIFGFVLTGISIFLGQASAAFEDASLGRSLSLMGVRRSFLSGVSLLEVLAPVVVVSLLGFMLGSPLAFIMFASSDPGMDVDVTSRILMALSFLGAGWIVTLVAVVAVEPLRTYALRSGGRRE